MALWKNPDALLDQANHQCIANFRFLQQIRRIKNGHADQACQHVYDVVKTVLHTWDTWTQAFQLHEFGSSCYGLQTPGSDVDLLCVYGDERMTEMSFLTSFINILRNAQVATCISDNVHWKSTVTFKCCLATVDFTCSRMSRIHQPLQLSKGVAHSSFLIAISTKKREHCNQLAHKFYKRLAGSYARFRTRSSSYIHHLLRQHQAQWALQDEVAMCSQ